MTARHLYTNKCNMTSNLFFAFRIVCYKLVDDSIKYCRIIIRKIKSLSGKFDISMQPIYEIILHLKNHAHLNLLSIMGVFIVHHLCQCLP